MCLFVAKACSSPLRKTISKASHSGTRQGSGDCRRVPFPPGSASHPQTCSLQPKGVKVDTELSALSRNSRESPRLSLQKTSQDQKSLLVDLKSLLGQAPRLPSHLLAALPPHLSCLHRMGTSYFSPSLCSLRLYFPSCTYMSCLELTRHPLPQQTMSIPQTEPRSPPLL